MSCFPTEFCFLPLLILSEEGVSLAYQKGIFTPKYVLISNRILFFTPSDPFWRRCLNSLSEGYFYPKMCLVFLLNIKLHPNLSQLLYKLSYLPLLNMCLVNIMPWKLTLSVPLTWKNIYPAFVSLTSSALSFYPLCLDFINKKVTATHGVKLDFRGVKMVSY